MMEDGLLASALARRWQAKATPVEMADTQESSFGIGPSVTVLGDLAIQHQKAKLEAQDWELKHA